MGFFFPRTGLLWLKYPWNQACYYAMGLFHFCGWLILQLAGDEMQLEVGNVSPGNL